MRPGIDAKESYVAAASEARDLLRGTGGKQHRSTWRDVTYCRHKKSSHRHLQQIRIDFCWACLTMRCPAPGQSIRWSNPPASNHPGPDALNCDASKPYLDGEQ
jgi:hypothetical protein